jgi:hypothetical protein
MDEMRKKEITNMNSEKMNWEPPVLISLDKGKTEGGFRTETYEDTTGYNPNS